MNTYTYANSLSEHKKWFAASPKVFFHPGVKLIEYLISFDFYDQFGFGIFDGFYVVWTKLCVSVSVGQSDSDQFRVSKSLLIKMLF